MNNQSTTPGNRNLFPVLLTALLLLAGIQAAVSQTTTVINKLNIGLYRATGSTLSTYMDGTLGRFNEQFTGTVDNPYNMPKQNNPMTENICLARSSNYFSIESRPVPVPTDTLFVCFYFTSNRDYALQLKAENFTGLNLKAFIQDQFTQTETEIPLSGSNFVYPFTVTTDAGSKALDRLRIVFRSNITTPVIDLFATQGIRMYPNPVAQGADMQVQFSNSKAGTYDLTVFTLSGHKVYSTTLTHSGGNSLQKLRLPASLPAGMYITELVDPKGERGTRRIVVR